jgi:hypothetical protein
MTLSLEKRYTQGLTLLASYTWSRALGVDPASILGVNSTAIVNPFNLKREYGPLEFDVVNRGVISYSYELPLGKGKRYLSSIPTALDEVIGGWQISGITTLQGGLPITPVLGVSLGKTFTNSRPDVVGDPTASARQPYNWLNRNAFAIPSTAQIAAGDFYGNTGRGSVRAPGLVNFDFSAMKNFRITENRRLQFRCEFFNLTNTPFFGGDGYVNVNVSSPTFGQITQAGDPRVIQLGLKYIF